MNKVKLIGRLTRDPELVERSGKNVCDMRLAVNGAGKTPPLFIDVVAFGERAEASARSSRRAPRSRQRGRSATRSGRRSRKARPKPRSAPSTR